MNHPLARALHSAGLTTVDIAGRLGVDPRTVARWLGGRVPYPRHRAALVNLTGWPEHHLWPHLRRPAQPGTATGEVHLTYAHRSQVPADVWRRHFAEAQHEIGILAYSGLFLAEDPTITRLLYDKARAGVRVRIALGDPAGRHIAARGADEGINTIMTTRIHNALILYQRLTAEPGVQMRLHDTVLYNSIYRVDDELLVNIHTYACPAAHAPVLHLRRLTDDGMVATYLDAFERVWGAARPAAAPLPEAAGR